MGETTTSRTESRSTSSTRKVLDREMLEEILAGLSRPMTQEEMRQYAQDLLTPQRHAELEAAQQALEASRLTQRQQIEDMARALSEAIAVQRSENARSRARIERDALRRGMGRSSYTVQTLAGQDEQTQQNILALEAESERKRQQVRDKTALAEQQAAETKGRIESDFARQLAAKIEELRMEQDKRTDERYMTAIDRATGSQTSTVTQTEKTSRSETDKPKSTSKAKTKTSASKAATGGPGKAGRVMLY